MPQDTKGTQPTMALGSRIYVWLRRTIERFRRDEYEYAKRHIPHVDDGVRPYPSPRPTECAPPNWPSWMDCHRGRSATFTVRLKYFIRSDKIFEASTQIRAVNAYLLCRKCFQPNSRKVYAFRTIHVVVRAHWLLYIVCFSPCTLLVGCIQPAENWPREISAPPHS